MVRARCMVVLRFPPACIDCTVLSESTARVGGDYRAVVALIAAQEMECFPGLTKLTGRRAVVSLRRSHNLCTDTMN